MPIHTNLGQFDIKLAVYMIIAMKNVLSLNSLAQIHLILFKVSQLLSKSIVFLTELILYTHLTVFITSNPFQVASIPKTSKNCLYKYTICTLDHSLKIFHTSLLPKPSLTHIPNPPLHPYSLHPTPVLIPTSSLSHTQIHIISLSNTHFFYIFDTDSKNFIEIYRI